jgi:uncharacterized protein YbaR (Trm112 family)
MEWSPLVDQSLLEILVCPETKQSLQVADTGLLERLNASIEEGSLSARGGRLLREPLAEGLVREDGAVLYPVRDDIPIMLIDEAIPLSDQR